MKIYQDGMAQMLGQATEAVSNKIAYEWKFGVLERWEDADPSSETVIKNNFKKHGFTKQEAQVLFAAKGAYKVMLFQKLVGQAEASTEAQLDMGPTGKHEKNVASELAYIRVVFRDGKLVHQQVW